MEELNHDGKELETCEWHGPNALKSTVSKKNIQSAFIFKPITAVVTAFD